MTNTNGDVSSTSRSSDVLITDSPLTVAVHALTAIASEAEQAVKKLQGVDPIPPVVPLRATAVHHSAMPVSSAPRPIDPHPTPVPRAPTGPTAKGDQMKPGEVLHPGNSLSAGNGNYLLAMQTDGNLVLYSGTSPLWASNTAGKPVAVCVMQGDGNLVLYDAAAHPLWASNTAGKSGAHLVVQDDGNVVIYQTNGSPAWATNTVHTIGSDTLIYRARLKRWTNLFAFGTKGNDTLLVKLPPGATLKSVAIEVMNSNSLNPNLNSPIGTQVGNAYAGARLTNVVSGSGFVAITTHWWFDAFSDAEYSICVWVTGPKAYPVEDNGTKVSANVDGQIVQQVDRWFENNAGNLIAAGVALAAVCADLATLGTATPVTTPALISAIGAAIAAGSKVALSPSK